MELERLQKIIAHAGFASRREAETMIREGRVTVNGQVVTELGTRAYPGRDHVKVDGKLITRAEPHRYILLYKPREVMTTVEDPQGRRTVIDLVRGVRERIYPVGRLDFHSEGLVLLTNDGDLAFKVSHPKHGSVKTYHVKVRGVPEQRLVEKLERGITIEGKRTLPCEISRMKTTGRGEDEGNSWFEVKLREGRTQQIRKMFQAVGHPVSKLRRVAIGPLSDPKLGPGDWRELLPREVKMLETMQEPAPVVRRVPARKAGAAAGAKKDARPARGAKARSTGSKSRGAAATTRAPRTTSRAAGSTGRATTSRAAGTTSRATSRAANATSRSSSTATRSRGPRPATPRSADPREATSRPTTSRSRSAASPRSAKPASRSTSQAGSRGAGSRATGAPSRSGAKAPARRRGDAPDKKPRTSATRSRTSR